MMIRFCGLDLVPDLSGALFVPELRTLLVADLHFEKASGHATRGMFLPPHDTRATLLKLEKVLAAHKPLRLVALGDSFHDNHAGERIDESDFARMRQLSEACDVTWITGNHDARLPQGLGGAIAESVAMGPVTLRHVPSAHDDKPEIAGHLHPVAIVTRKGRRIRARAFLASQTRLVLPAFGSLTGGLNALDAAFADIFPDGFTAHMIGKRGVHTFPAHALSD